MLYTDREGIKMKNNLIKRELTEDQENLIIAVKQGDNTLLINFQEFWKVRCNNSEYLLCGDTYSVLSRIATDVFTKGDWYSYFHKIEMLLFTRNILHYEAMNQVLVEVISELRMYWDKPITINNNRKKV